MAARRPAKMIAEYARSARSSCKSCGAAILSGELRLGSPVVHRGFTSSQWHHPSCFPKSNLVAAENFDGFDALKDGDKVLIRELVSEASVAAEASRDGDSKGNKRDDANIGIEAESSQKKLKATSEDKKAVDPMTFSLCNVQIKYKDAKLPHNWRAFETVIFREREEGLEDAAKIAAFDFDGCLAKTSVRSIGADKWSLFHPSIPEKLQELYRSGYKVVIFTNESNIDRWKNKRQEAVDSKVGRLDGFIDSVKVPMQVFIACGMGNKKGTDDIFRKPNPGMWRLMEQHFNSGIEIDMKKSFYVGDAAGRLGDHSDADIKFAEAVGLKFYVPEEYFGA